MGLGTGPSSLALVSPVAGVVFEVKVAKVRFDRSGLVQVSKCLEVIEMLSRERGLERMISARAQDSPGKRIEWLFRLLVLICGFCLMKDYRQRNSNVFRQKYE